ncbi:MAG: hypothetical protein R3B59_04325 [Dehalococcoidia bacterium]
MSREQKQRVLEGVVLRWLARLPLLREDDFALLTGEHEADTRRALQALVQLGWIERVRQRSSEVEEEPHSRYVLRGSAPRHFAEAFGLDDIEVRRNWPIGWSENLAHVTHFELTDWVNGMLVGLVASTRDSSFDVADVRWLPHARRDEGSWCPSQVEAYGCLRNGERFAHFLVAWDRLAAPAVHRRARVRAWYDSAERADHWGENLLPPILLVLPSTRLEPEWEHAVRSVAHRRDVDELEVFVADDGEACEKTTDAIWHRLGESYTDTLSRSLRWGGTPPPVDVPNSARFDLLARGAPVREPTLHEWADQVLGRAEAGPRDRTAALALRLEADHRDVRELLARHPLLEVDEIAERLQVPVPLVRRVVRDLERYGLIAGLDEPAPRRR